MNPFEAMAEPLRRRIVEILMSGEHSSGEIAAVFTHEFGVGRSAVQHHLAYLRKVDWVIVRDEYTIRWYRDPLPPKRVPRSRKGRRGHGVDPDDLWLRFE